MHPQKNHILFITTFCKWQKNSICGARIWSYTFLRPKNGYFGKIQNRTFFLAGKSRIFKYPIGYFNSPRKTISHSWVCPTTVYKRLQEVQKKCDGSPPHPTPIFREHITSILLFEIPKPFINRGWAESTIWKIFPRIFKISGRIINYPMSFPPYLNLLFVCFFFVFFHQGLARTTALSSVGQISPNRVFLDC